MLEDRREGLRRIEDVRQLLRFCHKFDQAVPSKVASRLRELGVADPEAKPISALLDELDALERPALEVIAVDRRARRRRFLTADLDE